ncbi:hypothetical protein MMC26_002232 [Xylographa opegraphella]|nr:hypothetical protein [Xylographa opegraphella]
MHSTDIELTLDPQGATGQACWWGRQKPYCCNTPKNLNPFLPVSLDKLFPTLPPVLDIPVFDMQTIASGSSLVGDSNPQVFGLVVIDGPQDAVTNLNKRDGSRIEFLSCDQERGNDGGTAKFLCMDSSESSNCNYMHIGGLTGTIMRMPEDCGFATYAVAHSVIPSLDQFLPDHLKKRAPSDAIVYDLDYGYDFALAKRDSGDIYLRVDYSDSHDYYNQVVAADHQKRTLISRFWSGTLSIWQNLIRNLRVMADQHFTAVIENQNFDIVLYDNDGSRNNCSSSQDGFLQLKLSGQVRSTIKWGVTMVGTIAPALKLEEAYSYFDSNPKLAGTLSFNGKGVLNIDGGNPRLPIFSSPITAYEFSHPGIISFSPTMNIEARLLGSGQIDGQVPAHHTYGRNQATFQVNQPLSVGDFHGGAAGNIPNNPFTGDVVVDTTQAAATKDGTVFALELLLENSLSMEVFQYDTSVLNGGASLNARIPHTIRIANTGSSQLTVYDGDQQASADVTMNGSIADWASTDTFATGPPFNPQTIHTESSTPPGRDPPKESGFAIFGSREYIQCSKSQPANITCPPMSDLGNIDPKFNDPDDGSEPLAPPRRSLEGLVILEKRTGGEREFNVYFNLQIIVTIFSHTYWTGGRELLQHNPNAGYYDLNNADCVDRTWNPNAVIPPGLTPAAEHILELQTHPRFLEFVMGANVPLQNGHTYHTTHPVIDPGVFATGGRYVTRWSAWDPAGQTDTADETPVDDVWRAYGDTNNAGHMVNTQPHWNNLKMQIIRGNDPIGDDRWQAQNLDDTTDTATGIRAASVIRDVIDIFDYMNRPDLHTAWKSSANGIRDALAHFQDRYNANVPNGAQPLANLPEMWDEYLRSVFIPQIQNNVAAWVERRINILIAAWDTAREGATGQREETILGILEALTQLKEAAQNAFIDITNLT